MRKHDGIEDLRYPKKNKVYVNEELVQFNDIPKLSVSAYEECKHLYISKKNKSRIPMNSL